MTELDFGSKRRPYRMLVCSLWLLFVACSFKSLDHLDDDSAVQPPSEIAGGNSTNSGEVGGEFGLGGTSTAGTLNEPRTNNGGASAEAGASGAPDGIAGSAAGFTAAGSGGAPAGEAPEAVLVVGRLPLDESDTKFSERLQMLGYDVSHVDDDAVAWARFDMASLIAITRSIESEIVGSRLRESAIPVLVWEPMLYDEMGMVMRGEPSGVQLETSTLNIVKPDSELAAKLNGELKVTPAPGSLTFGSPNDQALRIATLAGEAARVCLFAYEKDAEMPGLKAPARRVALFFSDQTALTATEQAWALFDAAVRWADPR